MPLPRRSLESGEAALAYGGPRRRPIVEAVIDPLKASCDPRLMLPTSLVAALRTAQVSQILSDSLDEIAEQVATDDLLTPDQRQRVAVLVRTILDVFELEPGARERGTTAVSRTALARLTAFEPELTRML